MIAVLYAATDHLLRATTRDHLYSFARHSGRPCAYVNLAVRPAPRRLRRVPVEMVVFDTTLLSALQWGPGWLRRVLLRRTAALDDVSGTRVALPQDEFLAPDRLAAFFTGHGVGHVFSVAPEEAWPILYPGLAERGIAVSRVLTGYLEPESVRALERQAQPGADRPVALGYRGVAPAWLGELGLLKARAASALGDAVAHRGLVVDVAVGAADAVPAGDWYRFLARCRWAAGAEGGASVVDTGGDIRGRVEAYEAAHPGASFEQIRSACFPGADGAVRLTAISPRHLEACVSRTAQALVRGDYNGVLEPGVHYLALEPDLSNVEEVADAIASGDRREEIVEAAYADVVASGRYDYRRFVEAVMTGAGLALPDGIGHRPEPAERLSWLAVRAAGRLLARARYRSRASRS